MVRSGGFGKRLVTACLLAGMLFAPLGATTLRASAEQETGDVMVKYDDLIPRNIIPTDSEGNGSLTLQDGTVLSVSGASSARGQLAIDPITEQDPLGWIDGCLPSFTRTQAYHIYYLNASSEMENAAEVTVSVKPVGAAAVVYALRQDGVAARLEVTADEDGTLRFRTNDSPYFVLGTVAAPTMLEGREQTVKVGAEQALAFRSDAPFSEFLRAVLDGQTLDPTHYTATEGSTVITLTPQFVASLSAGEHTLEIVSASGTASATFTVTEGGSLVWLPITLGAILLVGGGGFALYWFVLKKRFSPSGTVEAAEPVSLPEETDQAEPQEAQTEQEQTNDESPTDGEA